MPAPDPALRQWATETQARYLDAVIEYGSNRSAAKALGCTHQCVDMAIRALKKKAALAGYAPDHDMRHPVPSPFRVKGVSTYYDREGEARGQWVKSTLDATLAEEAIREFIRHLVEDARGLSPYVPEPAHADEDIMVVYPMGDPHFGMYSFAAETGADFDLAIAERLLTTATDRLVESAPDAATAIIAELGDFFHADSELNRTMSGHALDVDTRWSKVMQVGLRAMIHCINRALEKHRLVIVRIVKGNHDNHSSFALALALDAFFHNNDRVQIDLSPAAHWYYRFGKVLLGVTHGDTTKMNMLPGVMAADRAADWGLTTHRHWICGHIHHDRLEEFPGVTVEYFRTLAARDAWHASSGYRAGRDMRCLVMHREHGEIERHRVDIGMLKDAA